MRLCVGGILRSIYILRIGCCGERVKVEGARAREILLIIASQRNKSIRRLCAAADEELLQVCTVYYIYMAVCEWRD